MEDMQNHKVIVTGCSLLKVVYFLFNCLTPALLAEFAD